MRQSIHVRRPRTLHEHLSATAIEQDISLNGLIATLLAGSVGDRAPNNESPRGDHRRADHARAMSLLESRVSRAA